MRLNGLFLIGNNNFDNTGYTGQTVTTPNFRGQSTYKHFGFAPSFASVGNQSADSVMTTQFCGWGAVIRVAASEYCWNTTFFNIHLMTSEYEYMSNSDTADKGTPSDDESAQGPAFASFYGRLSLKRRQLRNHFVDYRTTGRPANRSGFAGNFGRWQRAYGATTTGWRYTSVTISNSSYQTQQAGSNGANASTPGGQTFEYIDKVEPLRRNGQGSPGISTPTTVEPEIINDNYEWGASQIQLNIKYMRVKPGLDYENNIQSNRTLYA